MVSVTGKPYDTLEEVIGLRGEGAGSLKEFGIAYRQLDLTDDGSIDIDNIKSVVGPQTKMVFIQRSRGYEWRDPVKVEDIRKAVEAVKAINRDAIVMVDNCYGEFTETEEPTQAGADIMAGSLIKNPGGGLVPAGGYIAGKKELVENAAFRLTSPGLGKELGATLGNNRLMFQGLFMAPHTVAESLKERIHRCTYAETGL